MASDRMGQLLDEEETDYNRYQSKAADKTKDALMKYDFIEQRANYFVFKLKNLTFGEYSDNVMYIAPLVTGKVEFKVYDFDLYYDHFNNNKSGIKYSLKF